MLMLRLGSLAISLGLLACAAPIPAVAPEPEQAAVAEPELEPADGPRKLTPTDNNAEALLAAADRITRVEICDIETGEAIATLPPALLDQLRAGLREGAISEGLSSEAAWSMILRIEVEGRREPFIVQFVTVALRVKPEDAWSLAIANEAGEIDWRIRDIYVDYELELDNEFEALVPYAEPQRYGEEAMPRPESMPK
jgi:hypothetical protein